VQVREQVALYPGFARLVILEDLVDASGRRPVLGAIPGLARRQFVRDPRAVALGVEDRGFSLGGSRD
jgi:hypothetical protein